MSSCCPHQIFFTKNIFRLSGNVPVGAVVSGGNGVCPAFAGKILVDK
jgi:hypothetical protein